jgi:putative FmdB family regulatory protein
MPTYEYACRSCGKHHDVVQSFTDDALTTCPSCGGSLRKVFGNIAIAFKGSGFYKTDNRSVAGSASTNPRTTSESSDGSGSTKESGAGGDSKSGDSAPKSSDSSGSGSESGAGKSDAGGGSSGSGTGAAKEKTPAKSGSGDSSNNKSDRSRAAS